MGQSIDNESRDALRWHGVFEKQFHLFEKFRTYKPVQAGLGLII